MRSFASDPDQAAARRGGDRLALRLRGEVERRDLLPRGVGIDSRAGVSPHHREIPPGRNVASVASGGASATGRSCARSRSKTCGGVAYTCAPTISLLTTKARPDSTSYNRDSASRGPPTYVRSTAFRRHGRVSSARLVDPVEVGGRVVSVVVPDVGDDQRTVETAVIASTSSRSKPANVVRPTTVPVLASSV